MIIVIDGFMRHTHTRSQARKKSLRKTCLWNESARSTWQLITVKRQRRYPLVHHFCVCKWWTVRKMFECHAKITHTVIHTAHTHLHEHKVQAKTKQSTTERETSKFWFWVHSVVLLEVPIRMRWHFPLLAVSSIYLHIHVAHSINPLIKTDLRWINCLFFALPSYTTQTHSPTVCIVMNSLFNDFGPDVHFPSS